jgi:hypothetical protein
MIIELTRHSIILITPLRLYTLHCVCYVTMKYPTKSAKGYNFECTKPSQMMLHALHPQRYFVLL